MYFLLWSFLPRISFISLLSLLSFNGHLYGTYTSCIHDMVFISMENYMTLYPEMIFVENYLKEYTIIKLKTKLTDIGNATRRFLGSTNAIKISVLLTE